MDDRRDHNHLPRRPRPRASALAPSVPGAAATRSPPWTTVGTAATVIRARTIGPRSGRDPIPSLDDRRDRGHRHPRSHCRSLERPRPNRFVLHRRQPSPLPSHHPCESSSSPSCRGHQPLPSRTLMWQWSTATPSGQPLLPWPPPCQLPHPSRYARTARASSAASCRIHDQSWMYVVPIIFYNFLKPRSQS